MKVVHCFKNQKIAKEISQDAGFLLTTDRGSYLSFFAQCSSRYQGWFVPFGKQLYKIIENIEPIDKPPVDEIRNNFWNIERKRGYLYESFVLTGYYNSLIYELSESSEIEITLDIKESYDNSESGRYYEIIEEKNLIIIKFSRNNTNNFYLAVKSDCFKYKKIGQWLNRKYQLDIDRNSPPFERSVYQPVRLSGQKFVFSISQDKNKAVKEAQTVFNKTVILKNLEREKINNFPDIKKIKDKEIKMAYLCARNSLASLAVLKDNHLGIYAGLPWFFQYWPRDEAISLKALDNILPKKASDILLRLMVSLRPDGRLIAMPSESADSVGWMFKRIGDFILKKDFKNKQIGYITLCLKKSIEGLLQNHTQNDLDICQPKETWMDSLDRQGARIELQASRLYMYQLAYKLTSKTKYLKLEKKLKDLVCQKMWDGKILSDGQGDTAARPNIFLAAYLYPRLLSKSQWSCCFENALIKLWLDWGGLASVDKNNTLFFDIHTGQDPKSYHNGDSWFYLNNLAALMLFKLGGKKFRFQVNKILEASTKEILWSGTIGHHSELSSAKQLKSEGCWAQAWSSAMYIELVNELLRI